MEPRNYSYDSGDNSVDKNLREKIGEMRSDLYRLKQKLYLEKTLLTRRRQELWGHSENYWQNQLYAQHHKAERTESIIKVNKADLIDIERKCDKELDKLNDYIFNVNQLKTNWIRMREAEKFNSRKAGNPRPDMSNGATQRRFPKGKVFYVDSDL